MVKQPSREELVAKLIKYEELLMSFAATYYTKSLMTDQLPVCLGIPTLWLHQAHELMEGKTLNEETLGQLSASSPEDTYTGYFEDRDRTPYLFTCEKNSINPQLRTTNPDKDNKLYPETIIWLQSCLLSSGTQGKPNKIWYLLQYLAAIYTRIKKGEINLPQVSVEQLEVAYNIVQGEPPPEALIMAPLESQQDKSNAEDSTHQNLPDSRNNPEPGNN